MEATAPPQILALVLLIGWEWIVALRAANKAVRMEANALRQTHAAALPDSPGMIAPNRSAKWDTLCPTLNLPTKVGRCTGSSTDHATTWNGAIRLLDLIVPKN